MQLFLPQTIPMYYALNNNDNMYSKHIHFDTHHHRLASYHIIIVVTRILQN